MIDTWPKMALTDRGHGPAVVLLHGQPGEGRDWELVADRLADRMRVIVPDRPGYGWSEGQAMGIVDNAELVVALLDRLGVTSAVIAGHSWSGAVALALAQRHPDRISGLVLVGSVGGEGSVDWLDHMLATAVIGPFLALAGLAVLRAPRLGRFVAGLAVPTAPDAIGGLATNWYRAWRSFVIEQQALVTELPEIAGRLADVHVPVRVVMGADDRVVRPRSQVALAGFLPQGELSTVAGAGHLLPREAPDDVVEAIIAVGLPPGG